MMPAQQLALNSSERLFHRHRVSPRWSPAGSESTGTVARHVFVGGSGRSGTTVIARLLGRHSCYAHIPIEVKFHTDRGGLPDVLANRLFMKPFLRRMQGRWFHWRESNGRPRGLHRIVSRPHIEEALYDFMRSYRQDRPDAARRLITALLDPLAEAAGRRGWVESTPRTIATAPVLHGLVPEAKFVHVVRDGRDVASSVIHRGWAPNSFEEALHWWAARLRAAEDASRRLPADRVLVVHFEELIESRRADAYAALLTFLGVDDEPAIRSYFDDHVDPARAHIGRWTADVPPASQARIERLYRRHLEDLEGDRVRCAPVSGVMP